MVKYFEYEDKFTRRKLEESVSGKRIQKIETYSLKKRFMGNKSYFLFIINQTFSFEDPYIWLVKKT